MAIRTVSTCFIVFSPLTLFPPAWLAKNKEWIAKADYGFNLDAMESLDTGDAPFFSEDDLNFRIGKTVLTEFFGKE